jgi:4-amino-4-deoxy-L-arabinose transferase-like glycosyltransferase
VGTVWSGKVLWAVVVVIAASSYLSLAHLDNTYFWDDEAAVAILAKNVLATGSITGWDGRNLWGYRNGTVLRKDLTSNNPPLDVLVTAGSFRLFGPSTWSARFPFTVVGLAALVLFVVLVREDFGRDGRLSTYAAACFGLSVPFVLNIRQCRYYALSLFLGLLTFYLYRRCLRTKNIGWFLLLSGSSILLFYANWLLCAAFLLTLGGLHLTFHRNAFHRREWGLGAVAAAVFLAATLPYAMTFRIWERPDIPTSEVWYIRKLTLLWWNVRELNVIGFFPWVLALGVMVCLLRLRTREPALTRTAWEWLFLGLGNVLVIALLSPQPTDLSVFADVRYLIVSLPFLMGLIALLVWVLHQRTPGGAIAVFGIFLSSNLFTARPWNWEFQWLLPSYIREVHRDYPTSNGEVVRFLDEHARPDDLIFATPEHHNYPLMFYLGDRLRFCCYLSKDTHLPIERLRGVDAPFFVDEHYPNWLIAFGGLPTVPVLLDSFSRPHQENGQLVRYEYQLVETLPVYWRQTQRPELFWHSFGPKTDFDLRTEAVYILKRTGGESATH